jgi:hypothetical protein
MPLQSSGAISIDDIRTELGSSSGSLRTLSAAAGKSTPDAMSEFYGYSSGPPDLFDCVAYTGNNTNPRSFNIGFQPDLVWFKNTDGYNSHYVADAIRGSSKYWITHSTATEHTDSTDKILSFNSNGFTIGNDVAINGSSSNEYAAWCWKAGNGTSTNTSGSVNSTVSVNSAGGFSVIQFTPPSTETSFTAGHGLSSAPEFAIFRSVGYSTYPPVMHTSLPTATSYLRLNSNATYSTTSGPLSGAPTSSVLNLSASNFGPIKTSSPTICYAFHSVSGVSKFGSYTGNGQPSGTSVTLGFQPRYVLIKSTTSSRDWGVFDYQRGFGYMSRPNRADPDVNLSLYTVVPNSTGFTITTGSVYINESNKVYIYAAFV